MSISWSLVRRSNEYRGVEGTTSKKKASNQTRNRKRDGNAIHRDGEGDQGLRGRSASHQTDARRDGQIQRRAGQGRCDAGGGKGGGLLQGRAHHPLREEPPRPGRAPFRAEGGGGRLLDLADQEQGRGTRRGEE